MKTAPEPDRNIPSRRDESGMRAETWAKSIVGKIESLL